MAIEDGLYREVCYEGSNEWAIQNDSTGAFIKISEIRNERKATHRLGAGMAGVSRVWSAERNPRRRVVQPVSACQNPR